MKMVRGVMSIGRENKSSITLEHWRRLMAEETFLGIPERWLDDPTWKCSNGHISKIFLKSELCGDLCLACFQPVRLCDPNEKES
jgi:hypothetical protein